MPTHSEIQNALTAARPHTPRFLFRYWNASSGGDPSLNTLHQITPAALKPCPLSTICQPRWDHEHFIPTIQQHLRNDRFASCFTSWSHSLAYVLSIAFARGKKDKTGKVNERAFVAVLDTEKCGEGVVVMHTKLLERLLGSLIPGNAWEFLIYGPIEGEAYSAVPFAELEPHMRSCIADANPNMRAAGEGALRDGVLRHFYEVAGKVGMLFAAPYRRAVIAHVLGILDLSEHGIGEAAKRIGPTGIPETWTQDPRLTNADKVDCHGVMEVLRANEILRQLVVLAGGKSGVMEPSELFTLRHEQAKAVMVQEIGRATIRWTLGSWRRDALSEYEHMMCFCLVEGENP